MTIPPLEIVRITGRTRWSAQARALTAMGIDHRLSAQGAPLVSEAVYEAWLGGDRVASRKRPKLNMDAVNAA